MKTFFTILLTLLVIIAAPLRGAAQTSGQVTGQLLDEQHQPLPFATVLLRQAADTTWVRGEVTQADGRYTFTNLAPDSYRITVIMLGLPAAPFSIV